MITLGKVRIGAGKGVVDDEGVSGEACCVEEAIMARIQVCIAKRGRDTVLFFFFILVTLDVA